MRVCTAITTGVWLAVSACWAVPGEAQSANLGRVSLFFNTLRLTGDGGGARSFSDLVGTLTLRAPGRESGFDYGLDLRGVACPDSENRQARVSIYDAYVGFRTRGLTIHLGQMWITDLGALGSVGGIQMEYRQAAATPLGRLRFGLLAGLDPRVFDSGFASGVRKGGAYVALEGDGARRHVLGFVSLRQESLTERQVVTMLNYVPLGSRFFLYQAAEYDLVGPGGRGHGGLNYFLANARYSFAEAVDLQLTYHHGRSIDARTITTDELAGRPIDPRRLDGYLFESAGGRATVTLTQTLRVWAGYSRDRGNAGDTTSARVQAGLSAGDLLGSGLSLTATGSRATRNGSSLTSAYVSLGRSLGRSVYLSADYTSSSSVLQVSDGAVSVLLRPRTTSWSLSSVINLSRTFSLLVTGELVAYGQSRENRLLVGITYRF